MKKLVLTIMVVFVSTSVFAYGIGIKGGYSKMFDDYKGYEDTWNLGLYFDMGKFIFNSLQFRPGLDYVNLETEGYYTVNRFGLWEHHTNEVDVWGIHLDWYWFFAGKSQFAPFIGFGPALNYYNFDDDSTKGDSDAGIEGFLGIEFNLSGPWSLMLEARYLWHDIADRDSTIMKFNAGLMYYF